jgi:hypothetical protein
VRRIVLLLALGALVGASEAAAHLGGPKGYTSTVLGFKPPVTGISARMLGGDDRMLLHNNSGKVLIIKGYDGEPYLRFSGDGVYENDRSPAVYLNSSRFANIQLPPQASAKAQPQWEKILPGHAFTWHDHRVHWMSPIPPPAVQKSPGSKHHIFDWNIPAEVNGKPVKIHGTLTYAPPAGGSKPRWWLLAVLLSLALVGAVGALLLYRRQPPAPA